MNYSRQLLTSDAPSPGNVNDEQQNYWQKDNLRRRDAQILDSHFNGRTRGRQLALDQNSMNAYSLPASQKVALVQRPGTIPSFSGAQQTFDENYIRAQAKISQNGLLSPLAGMNESYGNGEINATNILQQRMMSRAVQNVNPEPSLAQIQSSFQAPTKICTLIEGNVFYSALQVQNFGSTTPLVRTSGKIQGVSDRQFQVEGLTSCYCIDGLKTVDLQAPEPQRMLNLVKVSAAGLGTFLVPQQAIQELGQQPQGRTLLTDGRSEQQQMLLNQQRQQQMLLNQQQRENEENQRRLLVANQQPSRQILTNQSRPQFQNPGVPNVEQMGRNLLKKRGLLRG